MPARTPHPVHRLPGYELLGGRGIEIGALHEPAPLTSQCSVVYIDRISADTAREFFPELDPALIVSPDHVVDIDAEGLHAFPDGSLDFVVINHVIEHLANPVGAICEIFRTLRSGGRLAIGVPDKNYSFDRPREVTTFEHLLRDWQNGVTAACDEHYLDYLRAVQPSALSEDDAGIASHLWSIRRRREHVHVWTVAAFEDFLRRAFDLLGIDARQLFVSRPETNGAEYFGVWEKL
jgi:SAM-dependent methyltransferase